MTVRFEDFRVGDHLWFAHRFERADFEPFAKLSGDRNRLHHDAGYAAQSGFAGPIVPLHLAATPLSAIAGMGFPGDSSLYLGHELRAVAPVAYGDELVYSARVAAISPSNRVLTLSVLVLRGTEIVVEAKLQVQARSAVWTAVPSLTILRAENSRRALVTGAAGAIGSAIATALRAQGWELLLPVRAKSAKALAGRFADGTETIACDLASRGDVEALAKRIAAQGIDLVIHAASPPVDAPLAAHAAVAYSAFDAIVGAALPHMLRAQAGGVVLIGSTSVIQPVASMADYAAAKTMAQSVINRLQRFARHGIASTTIAPGFVETPFSEKLRPPEAPALLPEQVADAVLDAVRERTGGFVALEPGRKRQGVFAPIFGALPDALGAARPMPPAAMPGVAVYAGPETAIATIFRRALDLPPDMAIENLAIGETPNWDSLRHIQLVLELEQGLDIRLRSDEIERTRSYAHLRQLCAAKLAAKQTGKKS